MDPFVVFPAEWAAAGFEIHATPPTLPFPSGYIYVILQVQQDQLYHEVQKITLMYVILLYKWFLLYIEE